MALYGLPVLYALFVWWFTTGVIVFLDGFSRGSFRWTMLGATVLLVAALVGLVATSQDVSAAGAYCGFTCGLLIWGWVEVGFLMGPVTGPNKQPCPDGVVGWRRAWLALQTILYHELAIIVLAACMVTLTWGAPNQIGPWTFMVLWGMRQSAKLNVFLGVRNLSDEFLPAHLSYLTSFLTRRPMNLLFPLSVTLGTILTYVLAQRAGAATASAFEATGFVFLATLSGLAILEHWFLVVPLPATALWKWSLRSHQAAATDDSGPLAVAAACETQGEDGAMPAVRSTRNPGTGGSHEIPEFLPQAARRPA